MPDEIMACGHPRSELYFGRFALPEGECLACQDKYLAELAEDTATGADECEAD